MAINGLKGGGAERALQVLANHLARQGHAVYIYTLEAPDPTVWYEDSVVIRQLVSGPVSGRLRNVFLPLQVLALALALRTHRPDLCLSFLARSNFVNILASYCSGWKKIAISEHCHCVEEFSPSTWYGSLVLRLIRTLYPLAPKVVSVSAGVKRELVAMGVPAARITVIPNPIEPPPHSPEPGSPGRGEPLNIVAVGRLVEMKDHRTLLNAMQILKPSCSFRLKIYGDGPLRAELDRLIDELGLSHQVRLLGWSEQIYLRLREADLFVLSSRYEGFGNVLLESMAAGLPVISTDCDSGPREILADGQYGILVPVANPEAMAAAIAKLAADPELRKEFAQRSLQRAQDFRVERIAPLYEQLCY